MAMRKKPKNMIEKTVGVYMDRHSASRTMIIVGFINDMDVETLTVEYDGKKVSIPYSVVERLVDQVRRM